MQVIFIWSPCLCIAFTSIRVITFVTTAPICDQLLVSLHAPRRSGRISGFKVVSKLFHNSQQVRIEKRRNRRKFRSIVFAVETHLPADVQKKGTSDEISAHLRNFQAPCSSQVWGFKFKLYLAVVHLDCLQVSLLASEDDPRRRWLWDHHPALPSILDDWVSVTALVAHLDPSEDEQEYLVPDFGGEPKKAARRL